MNRAGLAAQFTFRDALGTRNLGPQIQALRRPSVVRFGLKHPTAKSHAWKGRSGLTQCQLPAGKLCFPPEEVTH